MLSEISAFYSIIRYFFNLIIYYSDDLQFNESQSNWKVPSTIQCEVMAIALLIVGVYELLPIALRNMLVVTDFT